MINTNTTNKISKNDLRQFTCTEQYHKDYLNLNLTDGTAFIRDKLKCNWLISDIASIYNFDENIKKSRAENTFFLVVLLIDKAKKKARLIFSEDTNEPILYEQKYEYTDISDFYDGEELTFYLIDNVLLLPSEY